MLVKSYTAEFSEGSVTGETVLLGVLAARSISWT